MAARSIASLSVSFSLVSIPVKLYSATEASRTISFNMLHKGCGSRLKQQYICLKEECRSRAGYRQGYEFAKDQYVMFTPEELKAMEEAGTHMAEITEFVPLEAVDPVYFDKAYPRPRQGRRQGLRAAGHRIARSRSVARSDAGPRAASIHRDDPSGRGRPGHAAAPLRRRGAGDEGLRDQSGSETGGVEARANADRAADVRNVRSLPIHGRGCKARRGGRAEKGRGPGDHAGRGARKPAARRSSISWKRCAPASKKADAREVRRCASAPAATRKPTKRAQLVERRRRQRARLPEIAPISS